MNFRWILMKFLVNWYGFDDESIGNLRMNFRWILMKFLVNWYGFHIVTDNLVSSGDRDKGVSITISIVGWTITMGLRISTNNSNSRLSNNSNWLSNTDELSSMSITIVGSLLVKGTLLSCYLSGNRLANLSGNWLALLSWDSNCDWEWD